MKPGQRTAPVPFDAIPGSLPQCSLPDDLDVQGLERLAVDKLNHLTRSDLTSNAVWRDLLTFTGTYRTFYGNNVYPTLQTLRDQKHCSNFQLLGNPSRPTRHGWLDVDVGFETHVGTAKAAGAGTVSLLKESDGEWRIWMLRTWMENFKGHGHPDELKANAANHASHDRTGGLSNGTEHLYGAVIVGGGQAGLSTAGRLQALDVSYVLIERNASIGDVWRNRYDSLRWHTSKHYGNLPGNGQTYAAEDDYMLPAKRIGAGHQSWAENLGINAWTGTNVESARYDEQTAIWTIKTATLTGERTIKAKNLIVCVGPGHATPVFPEWATADRVKQSGFSGTVLHGSKYKSCLPWTDKRGVVIGTANTAHDVAEDMVNTGMQSTMVQRGKTFVMPAEWLHAAEDVNYKPEASTAAADREVFTYPNKIMREITNSAVYAAVDASPERFDALERAGFKVDRYGDIYSYLYIRFGGHYVDIGASQRIVDGKIRMETRAVNGLSEDGLILEDGSKLPADLVVACTGFDHDFRVDAARVVGREVAEQMDDYWGMDAEGEIRGLAKKAGCEYHPNVIRRSNADYWVAVPRLYYHGGDIRICRWFSRFIALQVQADVLDIPLEVYND